MSKIRYANEIGIVSNEPECRVRNKTLRKGHPARKRGQAINKGGKVVVWQFEYKGNEALTSIDELLDEAAIRLLALDVRLLNNE
jgi:hypothetical protein